MKNISQYFYQYYIIKIMEQQKKKLVKQTIVTSIITSLLIILFIVAMATLRLGCDKLETNCNVTTIKTQRSRGGGAWCGIQYDITDYYTYRCPYNGPECESANTTIKCYHKYNCPDVECMNVGALIYAIIFGIVGGGLLIGGIVVHGTQWYNYRKKNRMPGLLNDDITAS